MPLVKWDDSFVIGHDVIDAQHKKLFDMTESLYISIVDGDSVDIKSILLELYKYTIYHFNEEEALMRKMGYQDLSKHKSEHDAFIQDLDKIADKARHEDALVEVDALNWLVSWLVRHISMSDRNLVQCLKE